MPIKVPAAPAVSPLSEGDLIEIGISSEVKVDRESNWISIKVSTKVRANETADQAHSRALATTHTQFEQTVLKTVEKIQEMSS